MAKIDLIRQALLTCRSQGIKIVPQSTFDWATGNPGSVNWIGAVLWVNREKLKPDHKSFLNFLEIDQTWFYRFHIGFSQGTVLIDKKRDDNVEGNKYDLVPERISTIGKTIAKEMGIR